MTTQQKRQRVDEAGLTALYEAGLYTQATGAEAGRVSPAALDIREAANPNGEPRATGAPAATHTAQLGRRARAAGSI
jgi:hypothetical protein